MRRALSIGRVVMVYLLLGFVTTWAVAWGLALLPPGDHVLNFWSQQPPRADQVGMGSSRVVFSTRHVDLAGFPTTAQLGIPIRVRPETSPGWASFHEYLDPAGPDGWGLRHLAIEQRTEWTSGTDDARGFPFLALWCSWPSQPTSGYHGLQVFTDTVVTDMDAQLTESGDTGRMPSLIGGLSLPNYVGPSALPIRRALPYYPIWSGLALNTAFYALLFFAVVRTARAFKHARRFRRGLCPRCKYDRLFDYRVPCPECGHEGKVRPAVAVA